MNPIEQWAKANGIEIVPAEVMQAEMERMKWICRYSTDGFYYSDYFGETEEAAIEECRECRLRLNLPFDMQYVRTFKRRKREDVDFHKFFGHADRLERSVPDGGWDLH